MSTDLWLDPDVTDEMSPFDWDAAKRRGAGISPFAIPRGVEVQKTSDDRIARLLFVYTNEEDNHAPSPLDQIESARVSLKISTLSHRISEIAISPPVDKNGLLDVSERLFRAAKSVQPRAKSFSYRMIAGVLNKFVDEIIAAEDE